MTDLRQALLRQAVDCLHRGGLVVIPTETFYGVAGDALSVQATGRLLRIKGRDGKPLPLIAGEVDHIRRITSALPERFHPLADRFWPGPLTLILPALPSVPQNVTAGTGTVGVRIPGPSFALDLARAFGGCLTATSANPAGAPAPTTVSQLDRELAAAVDLVIDGGKTPGGDPSTLLDLTVRPPAILRAGPLDRALRAFLDAS